MAIDLGSENLRVSLIKPGRIPISIVVNEMSKRKTPALVGFGGPEGDRLLGEEAASFAVRHADTVFAWARELLGRKADDVMLAALKLDHILPYRIVTHPVRQLAGVEIKEGVVVSGEELVASILQYAKQIAEAQSGGPVLDAVMAVPAYWGQAQRQGLIDAAELAGLNVMGLINTHTAAALQFGIERDFANKTQNVIFYDMGSGGTVVSLVRYSAYSVKEGGATKAISQLEVKDVEWDSELGANLIDAGLTGHFTEVFSNKTGIPTDTLLGAPRTIAKLKKSVRRTKEMLSANTAAPLTVEELHEGRDFQASITREAFEDLGTAFFNRARAPLNLLLRRTGIDLSDVAYVELLGGGTRVPGVQAALADILAGRTLDRHLDADEAVVLGASLFAANLSTSFRLRKFGMSELNMYGISLRVDEIHKASEGSGPAAGGEEAGEEEVEDSRSGLKLRNLLPYMKKLPSKRVVHFFNLTSDPLVVSTCYNDTVKIPPGLDPDTLDIATYTITGIDTVIKRYNTSGTVNLRFEAGHDGVLRLARAEAVVEYTVMEEKRVPVKTANNGTAAGSNTTAGAESDSGASEAKGAEEDGADDGPAPDTTDGAEPQSEGDDKAKAAAPGTADDGPKYEVVTVARRKLAKVALNVSTAWAVPPLTGDALKASRAQLDAWVAKETAKRAAAAAKNELEAYIIRLREEVETDDVIKQVSTEAQRNTLLTALTEAEDWLYMDGDGEPAAVFKARLATLKTMGDPIETRAQEHTARPEAVAAARKQAGLRESSAGLWAEVKPWISEEERKDVSSKVAAFLKWLDEQEAAQAKKAAHEEPAFTSTQVALEFEKLEKAFNKVANKRKPKPPPEPASANATAGNDTSTAGDDKTGSDSGDSQADQDAKSTGSGQQEEAGSSGGEDASKGHDEL